ncbi:MAG: DUF4262 domain-containing protein [Nocardiopsaceae bacterium]|nr:DUF4262 domain-containing protein [Nocardiopsaceae bacterium]
MNLPKRHPGRRRPGHAECSECPGHGPGAGRDADRLAYMNWVAGQVGEHGWAVPGTSGGDGLPPWAYSVGVWLTCQFAELIVCGAPVQNMTAIIDAIGARVADGEEFGPRDVLTGICPARLALRPVDLSWRTTGLFEISDEFYGFVRPPYLQVVWADADGRFPWQPGFHPAHADAQPFLWLPKDDNPPSPWTRLGK